MLKKALNWLGGILAQHTVLQLVAALPLAYFIGWGVEIRQGAKAVLDAPPPLFWLIPRRRSPPSGLPGGWDRSPPLPPSPSGIAPDEPHLWSLSGYRGEGLRHKRPAEMVPSCG